MITEKFACEENVGYRFEVQEYGGKSFSRTFLTAGEWRKRFSFETAPV